MAYIEKKYKEEINKIFNSLIKTEEEIITMLEKRSINEVDELAKYCAKVNSNINLILKKFYPAIKEMTDKLEIKSRLKFYYDLINSLTDLVRKIDEFQAIDDNYYKILIDFIKDKETLISGKYREISSNELAAFYDKTARKNLEAILESKFAKRERQFFAMGPLEEEIKKIGRIAGAEEVTILDAKEILEDTNLITHPKTAINYSIRSQDEGKLDNIGAELKSFLRSKGYQVAIIKAELPDLKLEREVLTGTIVTNAQLLRD